MKHTMNKVNKTYRVPMEIRFGDIDMNQHVNNAVYFTYMENARSAVLLDEFMRSHAEGFQFVVAEASCKYLRPVKLDDRLECEVSFAPVRPTSCDIHYRFLAAEDGKLYAEGLTRMVLFNANTGRPMPLPDWFIDKFLQ